VRQQEQSRAAAAATCVATAAAWQLCASRSSSSRSAGKRCVLQACECCVARSGGVDPHAAGQPPCSSVVCCQAVNGVEGRLIAALQQWLVVGGSSPWLGGRQQQTLQGGPARKAGEGGLPQSSRYVDSCSRQHADAPHLNKCTEAISKFPSCSSVPASAGRPLLKPMHSAAPSLTRVTPLAPSACCACVCPTQAGGEDPPGARQQGAGAAAAGEGGAGAAGGGVPPPV
jgi:hypothetical protein